MKTITYYQLPCNQIEKLFKTDCAHGLSSAEVHKRLEHYGSNALKEQPQASLIRIFIRQFQSPLIYVLLAAALIIVVVGNTLDAAIISVILFFNSIIGTIQESRTQNLLASLKKYLKTEALVLRDGSKKIIPTEQLVPGDIIILGQGERVGADARIISAHLLLVDESMLTGETFGIEKTPHELTAPLPIADQKNMLFKGTAILSGTATAIVVATGDQTELGKLGTLAQTIQTEVPLKRDLDILSRWILIFIFVSCIFLFIIGLWNGRSWKDLLIILSALFICVVPEGLPVVFTLALVNGAFRMAQEKVVVKKLHAAEGLGRTSVLVIDKTGTLTKNEMMVSKIYAGGHEYEISGHGYQPKGRITKEGVLLNTLDDHPALKLMAHTASLLNRTQIEVDEKTGLFALKGDPTQAAIYVFSQKVGLDQQKLAGSYQFITEIPFQADKRFQADFYLHNGTVIALILGAPEYILDHSSNVKQQDREGFRKLLGQGLRVIGAAYKEFKTTDTKPFEDQEYTKSLLSKDLQLLGFFGLQDTIRADVKSMINEARTAGLHIVMATGDHQQTALFVAKAVGIYQEGDQAIDGPEFAAMDDEKLKNAVMRTTVFSRLAPEQKMKLIALYHAHGHRVAMTGDGVNDAPSLVAADVGIAMGIVGTEVAKEAADIILLDDSFGSIINAVAYSRHIFTSLRRVILYFFATNLAELLLILCAIGLNLPILPLTAVQIFWLNLVTDGFLNVALALEPYEQKLDALFTKMRQKLVDIWLIIKTLYLAIPMTIGSFILFNLFLLHSVPLARTMALVSMALFQWMNAWNCRSETRTNFQLGWFSNHWLIVACIFVFLLQILLVYAPFMQLFFGTVPLSLNQWLLMIGMTSLLVVIEEMRKVVVSFYKKDKTLSIKIVQ